MFWMFFMIKWHVETIVWFIILIAFLFHGTTADTVPKITQQGFNRAFAGKNAVAYGRGVYYARDASYSDHYAVADASGNNIEAQNTFISDGR